MKCLEGDKVNLSRNSTPLLCLSDGFIPPPTIVVRQVGKEGGRGGEPKYPPKPKVGRSFNVMTVCTPLCAQRKNGKRKMYYSFWPPKIRNKIKVVEKGGSFLTGRSLRYVSGSDLTLMSHSGKDGAKQVDGPFLRGLLFIRWSFSSSFLNMM